jgi:hypothetical protein
VRVSTHAPAHAVVPPGQVVVGDSQRPETHEVPALQRFPHAPQLAGSRARVAQVAPQLVSPTPQVRAQLPEAQSHPAAHPRPHWPQFVGSARRSRQTSPQRVKPGAQAGAPLSAAGRSGAAGASTARGTSKAR